MQAVILIIHLVICVSLIGLVLLQRSEGGALGVGGGSGSLMSGRGAADTLAKMTSFAGAFFLGTSLLLTWMSGAASSTTNRSIFDAPAHQTAPVLPVAPAPILPATPDPTQSSAPEVLPSTQLASTPAPSAAIAPPPTAAASHAAPVTTVSPTHHISTTVAGPLAPAAIRTPPAQRASATPASTNAHPTATASTRPATAPTNVARNQPAATAPVTTNHTAAPQTLPPGVALTQTIPESGDTSQNGLEAVRHSRAGPDQ